MIYGLLCSRNRIFAAFLSVYFLFIVQIGGLGVSWDWGKWWTYDGISGPQFWGLINPEWSLCTHGRRQSPINIEPSVLLYDPNLRHLHIDKHRITGVLNNTGHSIIFSLNKEDLPLDDIKAEEEDVEEYVDAFRNTGNAYEEEIIPKPKWRLQRYSPINITGGPLSYKYQVSHIQFHFGAGDGVGSEHSVNSSTFPAELQIYGFNSELYNNFTDAVTRAHGIVGISVLIQVGMQANAGLRPLTDALQKVRWAETWTWVEKVSIKALLPDTHYYITYDGSLTQPPCHETVTWVLMNRPVYITKQQLHSLRQLRQGSERAPKAKLVNNYRPTQQLLDRPLRTNIDFSNSNDMNCHSMSRDMHYKANSWR